MLLRYYIGRFSIIFKFSHVDHVVGCTTPSIGVAQALGLWQWIEYENTVGDVVDIFI